MAKLTVEFILGLIGGILGILGSLLAIVAAISILQLGFLLADNVKQTASGLLVSGFLAFLLSILGIIGSALVSTKRRKLAGWLIVISAVGGLILISFYYVLAFIFLIIAGGMALIQKNEDKKDIESKETIPSSVGSSILKTPEDTKKDSGTKKYIRIVLRIIRLFFVFIFLLGGFSSLIAGKFVGVFQLSMGLLWIHPLMRKVSQITNFKFTRTIKIILTIVLFLLALMLTK